MSTNRSRQFVTLLLVFGAVIFGMVIAGGVNLTSPGLGAPEPAPQGIEPTRGGVPSFADLAEAVLPAVVSVGVVTIGSERPTGRSQDPFEFFFGPRGRQREQEPQEFRSDGAGSGFLISADGWIVTNNHVIDRATEVRVGLDGRQYDAEVKGTDPKTDLALLKIDPDRDMEYLALGNSDELRVGDWVMAIGNPFLLEHTVTVGVVSAKGRQIGLQQDSSFENFIQTDAAINRGNSGGPVVNLAGQVIGISTAMNFGAENIGFAVPVSTLKQILPQLKKSGRVRRGYLGVTIQNLDYESMEAFGLDSTDGALVVAVMPDSPADNAGIRHEDILLKVDTVKVTDTRNLIDYVAAREPGSKITLELIRDGKRLTKEVDLEERDSDQVAEEVEEDVEGEVEWLGLQYQNLTPGIRSMHRIPSDVRGVWVTAIAPDSPLYDESVRPGNVIVEVNGEPVPNVAELEERVSEQSSGSFLRLYVLRLQRRGNPTAFLAIVRVP